MMASCYNNFAHLPCAFRVSLGYRSVSVLARSEAEGLIYASGRALRMGSAASLRVNANHHEKDKDGLSEDTHRSRSATAGGSPAASHFFLLRQRKSNQKEGDPGLPPLRGSLRCSTGQAAAELALRAQTVLADIP